MKCPNCGAVELTHDTRDMPYTYKGDKTTIPAVTGDYCPACGEAVLDMGESVRTSTLMLEFNKQVNAAIVDPSFIVGVRKTPTRSARGSRNIRRRRQRVLSI